MKYASEGFGYIKALENGEVLEFTEKPDILTAEEYFRSGTHFVNSGIYVFKGAVLLQELQRLQPQLYRILCPVFRIFSQMVSTSSTKWIR